MFSQFFEKKHLRVAGTAKNLSNTGLTEKNNTPKSSLKNLTKLSCQSSQKKSTSPFNTRSKSPISRTYQKNLTSTPKHIGTCPSTEKPFEKNMMTTKASPLLKKKESGNNMLEILTRKTTKNTMNNQKEITLKKNQIVNYLTTPSNMRVQTLPDVSGLEFDSLRKNFNHMHNKKTKLPDKKNSKSSKEETIFKNDPTSSHSNIRETSSNLRENNMSKPSSDYNYRKDDQKSLAERDLSNHSVKSSYSVNMVRKPIVKNPNVNDKTANYTMHISKEKVFRENEGLNLNEKLLFHVRMNEFDKMMDLLEKNKMNKLINFNYKGENDWAALHYACLNGNSKILNIFLYNEAFIDCETTSKLTPLMIACQKGFEEIVTILIRAGADINLKDLTGNTALHHCSMNDKKKIVELLLKKLSIAINMKNIFNKTAKECSSSIEIVKLLENFEIQKKNKENNHIVVIKNVKAEQFLNIFKKVSPSQKDIKDSIKTIKNPNENFSSTNTTATNNNSNNITHNTLSFINNEEDFEKEKNLYENDKINLDSFIVHGLIGKGSFGEVYLVEKKESESLFYAMKVLHKSKIMKNNLIKYALTERNVLSLTNHPFIVKLIYAFQTTDKLFLIMEFCPGGDLGQHLQKEKKFCEDRVKIYIAEIVLALEDLHKRDVIFRDLKPDNIVLDKDGHAMLTDFGLSKEGVEDSAQGAKSFCGSVAYLAPEMLKRTGHGKAVDWYLLGVVMYEMLVGIPPYYANNKEELFMNIEKAPLKIPSYISPEASSLLKALLQRNPAKRLGSGKGDAEELKCHPFFKTFQWIDVENRKLKPPIPQKKVKINTSIGLDMLANIPDLREDKNGHVTGWSFVAENN